MLGLGAYLVLQMEMTAGAMIAGSILLGRALAPIEMAVGQWSLVQSTMKSWDNLADLLGRVPPPQPRTQLPRPRALLDVQQATVIPPAATLAPVTELETGAAPAGLAVGGGLLASADRDGDMVSVFDLGSLELLHRIPVGERPFGLAFAPDGRLFAGNVGSNDVSVLDAREGIALATVPVGERPYGIAFALGRAFVTNQYADSVSVIDLATLEPVATIDVGEYPEGIDIAGSTVVVANWFENTVTLIDAATLDVTGTIATADGPRAFGRFVLEEAG